MKKEKYQKILIGITLIAILLGLKAPQIKADTITPTYKQYRVQYFQLSTGTNVWTSWTNLNTSTPFSNGYGVSVIATRFGYSTKYNAGQTYRIIIESGWSPSSIVNDFMNINTFSCYGSNAATSSSWSNDASLLTSCTYVGATRVSGTNHVRYIFDIEPYATIGGVQINISYGRTEEVNAVNVYTKSQIITGTDIGSQIEEQTVIIQEGFIDLGITIQENIEEIIDKDHIYDTEDITPQVEALEYQQEQIEDYMNLNTQNKFILYWNGDAIQYIWNFIGRLLLNEWLEMIFMSVFALGIMKLILGR